MVLYIFTCFSVEGLQLWFYTYLLVLVLRDCNNGLTHTCFSVERLQSRREAVVRRDTLKLQQGTHKSSFSPTLV